MLKFLSFIVKNSGFHEKNSCRDKTFTLTDQNYSNKNFVTLGASNHSKAERQKDDFYSTDPKSLELFLNKFKLHDEVWECACGMGHLSQVLLDRGYKVHSSDLYDRGYGVSNVDFLSFEGQDLKIDILTNPPYKHALEFVKKALEVVDNGRYVAMFLKVQFLETKKRFELFKEHPPKYVFVHVKRQMCYIDGNMDEKTSSAVCYCWFVWEKGYSGLPMIDWLDEN